MSEYPILVAWEDFKGAKASTLGCARCGFTRQATEDEIGLSDGLPPCPACCDPKATDVREWPFLTWKYEAADRCPGCGTLGFYDSRSPLKGSCSRRCMLQAEYAASLKA